MWYPRHQYTETEHPKERNLLIGEVFDLSSGTGATSLMTELYSVSPLSLTHSSVHYIPEKEKLTTNSDPSEDCPAILILWEIPGILHLRHQGTNLPIFWGTGPVITLR